MGLTKACFATATPSLHKPLLATPKYQNYYITLQHNKKTIYTLLGIIPNNLIMDYQTALNKATSLCVSSEKCEYDLKEKLDKWAVDVSDVIKIIEQLKKDDFINEKRYCNAFVKDKFKFNRWGKTKIAFMLRQKGISNQSIESAIDNIDTDEYISVLTDILSAKHKTIKDKDPYQTKAKLYNFAVSRGFENEVIKEVIKRIL